MFALRKTCRYTGQAPGTHARPRSHSQVPLHARIYIAEVDVRIRYYRHAATCPDRQHVGASGVMAQIGRPAQTPSEGILAVPWVALLFAYFWILTLASACFGAKWKRKSDNAAAPWGMECRTGLLVGGSPHLERHKRQMHYSQANTYLKKALL